jgi:hypothetical protein
VQALEGAYTIVNMVQGPVGMVVQQWRVKLIWEFKLSGRECPSTPQLGLVYPWHISLPSTTERMTRMGTHQRTLLELPVKIKENRHAICYVGTGGPLEMVVTGPAIPIQ